MRSTQRNWDQVNILLDIQYFVQGTDAFLNIKYFVQSTDAFLNIQYVVQVNILFHIISSILVQVQIGFLIFFKVQVRF